MKTPSRQTPLSFPTQTPPSTPWLHALRTSIERDAECQGSKQDEEPDVCGIGLNKFRHTLHIIMEHVERQYVLHETTYYAGRQNDEKEEEQNQDAQRKQEQAQEGSEEHLQNSVSA